MSSEMKPQLRCMSRRRTVLVLPVSVWADMMTAPLLGVDRRAMEQDVAARHEQNRRSGSTMFVYRTWCDQVSSQFASSSTCVADRHVERGRQRAEVLAVADRRRRRP